MKKIKKKNIKILCLLVLGIIIMTTSFTVFAAASLKIESSSNYNNGRIDLNWSVEGDSVDNYVYKVYKKESNEEFQPISSVDFTNELEVVNVLNIYPEMASIPRVTFTYADGSTATLPKSAALKVWIEGGSINENGNITNFNPTGINPLNSRQLIKVTSVSSSAFDSNPEMIWNYDVAMFGTWDCNGNIDDQPEDNSVAVVKEFLDAGFGVVAGHDTIGYTYENGLNKIRSYFAVDSGCWRGPDTKTDKDINAAWGYISTTATVVTDDVLTSYPWNLPVGTKLSIPRTHTCANAARGIVPMQLTDGSDYSNEIAIRNYTGTGNPYYYVTRNNNAVMIQTGHSNCESTEDERKVLANALFYLKQMTELDYSMDNNVSDSAAPQEVSATNITRDSNKITVSLSRVDNGTDYEYYVEGINKNNGSKLTSNNTTANYKSEVKGYSYVIDENPNTDVDSTIDTTDSTIEYTLGDGPVTYIHVRAIDNAGNVGPVSHIVLHQNVGPEMELSQNPTEWTNGNVVITANATDTDGSVVSIKKPDGSIENASSTTYEVEQNGTYEFVATDNSGETVTESIEITNIDKVKPQGEYSVEQPTEDVRAAVISISAKDNESGVSKIIKPDGTEVTEDSTTYSVTEPDTYTFKVVDVAGNETEIYVTVTIVSDGVDVRYVDIKHEDNILHEYSINGNVEDEYTTQQNEYDGYRFVKVEGNASGSLAIDKQTVTYYYIKQSNVNVYHKDEITGEVLQQEIPATYDEGEEYTTSKKEIVGYTQTSDSKNTAGTVEREDIEVTYYYKKNTSVIVKYVDMVTGDTLDSTKIDGLENDEYTTEKKDIEGYEYIETQGKANGKMEREPLNVVYYYKKVSNLITEHIDANTGDKIIEDVVTGYKEGDRYEALPQNLEGYIVVESPKETTGTMGREDVVKTFYYKKISAGLTVKYVDDITGELLDSKEYTGNEKDVITLEEKSFKYYVVTGRPDFSEVELTVEPQEVVYYYTRVSKVEIEGIDQDTGEVIYETEVTGLEGDKYETYPRQLEGYELVVVPENQNGEYKRDNEKVVYEYRKVAGKLTVKYVDDETGEILESYEIEGLRGDSYKTEKKEFEGYKLVRVEGEEIGELTEEGKEVIYHYEKKTGKIIVRYVDEEGNELLKEEMTGKVGEEYKVEEKEIEGYEVVERPEKLEGEYKEGETELVFVLRREKGTIKVEFVDEDGNVIQEAYVEENYVGEEFYIELPEIEGYKIVGDSKVKATFVEGELVIEAKYEKIQEEVNIDTGDIAVIAIVCVAVVCVAGIVYVVIRNKKKNSK